MPLKITTDENGEATSVNLFSGNYKVKEIVAPEGYEVSTSTEGTVTTLTNKHTPETTSLEGKKVWKDNDNQDGARPASQ